ncbi:DUF2982 domain-containing protein [Ferrimonas balearica]|uniref:DUF2982 domain-containing protein n=1 Tax=Ferrimonas balearica TaxID=44012 RepID=UPI001C99F3B7|nr:DUF2982 domain-containing protein [Ferrimonas balearica]MBY5990808.1 DUF2982 domain-containing protein [Ferrimonas balearica]
MDVIRIQPIARRNRLTFSVLAGLLCLAFLLALFNGLPLLWLLPLSLVTLVVLVLAIGKRLEPDCTLKLHPDGLHYRHRRGSYRLDWQQLLRIDQPGLPEDSSTRLDYVGIRLRDPAQFYRRIAPRLALALIREQRPLSILADPRCATGQCQEMLPEAEGLPQEPLEGVQAAYAAHQLRLRAALGYDLFLHHSALDRSPQEFVSLLRRYQADCLSPGADSTTETAE